MIRGAAQAAGLAVDAIHRVGDWWDPETITVGEVAAVLPHPDADRHSHGDAHWPTNRDADHRPDGHALPNAHTPVAVGVRRAVRHLPVRWQLADGHRDAARPEPRGDEGFG